MEDEMSEVVRVERDLRKRLLHAAREDLGPAATEAEVQALADEEYWGHEPQIAENDPTAEKGAGSERRQAKEAAEVLEWGLPEI